MPYAFRAIALDYDGTLVDGAAPTPDVLAAIAEARAAGRKVILCTGRILSELRRDWTAVDSTFDAVVGENGAVIATPANRERAIGPTVSPALDHALAARGVPFRRGIVLLALDAAHDRIALEEIARLGLDCQLVRNRGALMVLPPGITKGSGLVEALAELGISRHSTIAIGDAENDHTLLHSCELGVAVANALPALKDHADIVLEQPDGAGIAAFLRGAVVSGEVLVQSRRWRASLGFMPDGEEATLPASRINVLITGATNSGKSYLAGLLAERLVNLGYVVCVIDPEGDHGAIGELRGVLSYADSSRPPAPEQLPQLIRHRFSSIVVDLSLLTLSEKREYWAQASAHLRRLRAATGLPHWIILDEADQLLAGSGCAEEEDVLQSRGLCFVTYHPRQLPAAVLRDIDVVLALRGAEADARVPLSEARPSAQDSPRAFDLPPRYALLADHNGTRPFRVGLRDSRHVRHWHKYLRAELPAPGHFHFRAPSGPTGRSARNITDFHRELRGASPHVLDHHFRECDFSKWIRDVISDEALASNVRSVERWYQTEQDPDFEVGRGAVLRAIEERYGDGSPRNGATSSNDVTLLPIP